MRKYRFRLRCEAIDETKAEEDGDGGAELMRFAFRSDRDELLNISTNLE